MIISFFSQPVHCIAVLSIIIFFCRWSSLLKWEKFILLIISQELAFETICYIRGQHGLNNNGLYSISNMLTSVLTCILFYQIMHALPIKKSILIVTPMLILVSVLNLFFGQGWNVFNTFTYLPTTIWVTFLAFCYLRQCMDAAGKLLYNLFFWYATSTLIYYICSASVLGILPYLAYRHPAVMVRLLDINLAFYTLWYTLITIGLLWKKKQPILSSL